MATYSQGVDRVAPLLGRAERATLTTALKSSTLARFLLSGGISFIVNQALLYLLYENVIGPHMLADLGPLSHLDGGLLIASVTALEVSILVRFALNDNWTFRGRRSKSLVRRLLESNFGSLAAPAIALGSVNLLTPALGISYLLANAFGIAIGLAWNWLWSSWVVWRPQSLSDSISLQEEVS